MKGNKDYFAGFEALLKKQALLKKSKPKTERMKKSAGLKHPQSRSKERLPLPRFPTDHRLAEVLSDKTSRSKSRRSQDLGRGLLTSTHKLRLASGRQLGRQSQRKTSLDKNIKSKGSQSPKNKQRSSSKEIRQRASQHVQGSRDHRIKPSKSRSQKKGLTRSKEERPEQLDEPPKLLKNTAIRSIKQPIWGHPNPDQVRRSQRQSYSQSGQQLCNCQIQTSFRTERHALGFHRMQQITIAPEARSSLGVFSPTKNPPKKSQLAEPGASPKLNNAVASLRQDGSFRLHRYRMTERPLCAAATNPEIERKVLMTGRASPIPVAQGISTNLFSILRYMGRVQVYLEPMKGQVCRRLALKGRSHLERIRGIQLGQQPDPGRHLVIPQYIFQEVEQLYGVSESQQPHQYYHERCIFDYLNEKLAERLRKHEPYSWEQASRRLRRYSEMNPLFEEIEHEIVRDSGCLYGLHCQDYEQGYLAESFEEEFRMGADRLTDATLETVIQLTDLIFEELIDELVWLCR